MPNVMAAPPNIGGALCESSVIPFLVPRGKVWLTPAAGVPCSKGQIPLGPVPRNFLVANVTRKSPTSIRTSYEEVGRVGRVANLSRGSYELVGECQIISTCRDGLDCR